MPYLALFEAVKLEGALTPVNGKTNANKLICIDKSQLVQKS